MPYSPLPRRVRAMGRRLGLISYDQGTRSFVCHIHGEIEGSAAMHIRFQHPSVWEKARKEVAA